MKPSAVKPGEIRILKALEYGPLSDTELKEKALLASPNIRIEYLRNLTSQGLTTRDLYTRKYSIADKGREMLRLDDERNIIEDQMKKLLEEKEGVDISSLGERRK